MRRHWPDPLTQLPDFKTEVVEVREFGPLTLSSARFRGRGPGSDAPFEQVVWQLAEWRDGRIAWWRAYGSEVEALAAVAEISAS